MAEHNVFSQAPPDLIELTKIIEAIGGELSRLGHVATNLQETLSPLANELNQNRQKVEDLQALDSLSQHLFAVADFLNALAPTLPAEWRGDPVAAARTITLSNLARRLCYPHLDLHCLKDEGEGAFELFEAGSD